VGDFRKLKITFNLSKKRAIVIAGVALLSVMGVAYAFTLLNGSVGTITVSASPGGLLFTSMSWNGVACTISTDGSTATCPATGIYEGGTIAVSITVQNPGQAAYTIQNGVTWNPNNSASNWNNMQVSGFSMPTSIAGGASTTVTGTLSAQLSAGAFTVTGLAFTIS
jgi:hypothetical protein